MKRFFVLCIMSMACVASISMHAAAAQEDFIILNDQVFHTGFVKYPVFKGSAHFDAMVRHAKQHMHSKISNRRLTFKGVNGESIYDSNSLRVYLSSGNRLINVIGGTCLFSDAPITHEIQPGASVIIAVPARVIVRNADGSYAVDVAPGTLDAVMQIVPCE